MTLRSQLGRALHRRSVSTIVAMTCAAFGAALAAQPTVSSVSPAQHDPDAPNATSVSATFSGKMQGADGDNFIVHSSARGRLSGAGGRFSGAGTDTLSFTPNLPLFAGEEIQTTLTTKLTDDGSKALAAPFVWRFTAKTAVGPMTFAQKSNLGDNTTHTWTLVFGDVDGDGDLDLACGRRYSQSRIYVNDGRGRFYDGDVIGLGADSYPTLALGDLDGDGDLDLVEALTDAQNSIHFNNGTGVFTFASNWGTGIDYTSSVALGDLDGDGDLDIAAGNGSLAAPGSQNVTYVNDGRGGFSKGVDFGPATESNTRAIKVADMDNDGDLDIVSGNYTNQNLVNYNNRGDGSDFSVEVKFGTGTDKTYGLDVGDVNNDGWPDIAVANYFPSNVAGEENRVYFNDRGTDFAAYTIIGGNVVQTTSEVALGDFNGDGWLDALTTGSGNGRPNYIYLNDKTGKFPGASGVLVGAGSDYTFAQAVGDVDGDGDLDIAIGNNGLGAGEQDVMYYNGDSPARITTHSPIPNARENVAYTQIIVGELGTAPYKWSLTNAPAWLSINADTGTISGTPTSSDADKLFTFDVVVRDENGAGAPISATFELYVNGPAKALPYSDNFESGMRVYSQERGSIARAQLLPSAANNSGMGLQLDVYPGVANWPLQPSPPGAGPAGADDPSRWTTDCATHTGALVWNVEGTGVNGLDVSFDWKVNYNLQDWYANLVFEVNDGSGWKGFGGTDATMTGVGAFIYRSSGSTTPWNTSTFTASGLVPAAEFQLRLRWAVKLSMDDLFFPMSVWVDNLSVSDGSSSGPGPNTAPSAATTLYVDSADAQSGASGSPVTGIDDTPVFSAQYNDADVGDIAYAYRIQVSDDPTFAAVSHWDSGNVTMSNLAAGQRCANITYAGTALSAANTYYWRIEFWDDEPSEGAWSTEAASFTVNSVPPQPLPLTIVTTTLADGDEGAVYAAALTASGGVAPYAWSCASVPPGLALNAANGTITGTPTFVSPQGITVDITVTDTASTTASRQFTLVVRPAGQTPVVSTPLAAGGGGCAISETASLWQIIAMLAVLGMVMALRRRSHTCR